MERLDDLEAFLSIVEKGSQAAAARHLRRSVTSVNRSLLALEQSLGVQLLRRSTRRSDPTEAGLAFYERTREAFGQIMQARLEAADRRDEIGGTLRVGAPIQFASRYVVPAICAFMKLHPAVRIELSASDEQADLLADRLDVAVRIGASKDESLIAKRVGLLRVVTFGAPSYFSERGRPARPDDLVDHDCIVRAAPEQVFGEWAFRLDGSVQRIKVCGRFQTNNAAAMREAAVGGRGIAQLPLWHLGDLIETGALETILEPFEMPGMPVQLAWPPSRAPLDRTRRFIDFLADHLQGVLPAA